LKCAGVAVSHPRVLFLSFTVFTGRATSVSHLGMPSSAGRLNVFTQASVAQRTCLQEVLDVMDFRVPPVPRSWGGTGPSVLDIATKPAAANPPTAENTQSLVATSGIGSVDTLDDVKWPDIPDLSDFLEFFPSDTTCDDWPSVPDIQDFVEGDLAGDVDMHGLGLTSGDHKDLTAAMHSCALPPSIHGIGKAVRQVRSTKSSTAGAKKASPKVKAKIATASTKPSPKAKSVKGSKASHKKSPKTTPTKITPRTPDGEKEKLTPLKMTPRNVYSRMYHKTLWAGQKEGLDVDEAKRRARIAAGSARDLLGK
jgi:hypothetical protein